MSLRRQLLVLIATAFSGLCLMLYSQSWRSEFEELEFLSVATEILGGQGDDSTPVFKSEKDFDWEPELAADRHRPDIFEAPCMQRLPPLAPPDSEGQPGQPAAIEQAAVKEERRERVPAQSSDGVNPFVVGRIGQDEPAARRTPERQADKHFSASSRTNDRSPIAATGTLESVSPLSNATSADLSSDRAPRRQHLVESQPASPTSEHQFSSADFIPSQPPRSRFVPEIKAAAHATQVPVAPALNVAPVPNNLPGVLQASQNYVLAAQPHAGDHWKNGTPLTDRRAKLIEPIQDDFSFGPNYDCHPYEPSEQQRIYEGKTLHATQRPLLEIGRPWYQLGQLSPGSNLLGSHNPLEQQFVLFGDFRSGFASNSQNGDSSTLTASQLNLNFDWKLTSTERFHMFVSPLTRGLDSTGYLFDEKRFLDNTNTEILFGYFEGDLGAMVGGLVNKTYPFDLPFTVGMIPLIFQNGVWMEDAILGFAFTIPSRNSPRLDISNMDITFFAGYDKLVSDAFPGNDNAAKMYGVATFIEAWNGYVEADYAFIEDRTFLDRSYHNFGIGYTRRFGRFVSNSTRAIFNIGQNPNGIDQTADGVLLLSENSLITGAPSTVVPYFNLFAGFDRPQSAARAVQAGGVLRNTGILFETDNLTNYPTLDPTANDTFGAAFGLNLLASDFGQQLVLETAFVNTLGSDLGRNALGNQYGLGARYQLPLSNALIFRADAMVGFLDHSNDIHGVRVELRHKF